jgi:hypothetical protein
VLAERFPDVNTPTVRRVIEQLRKEGRLRRIGAGRGALWTRE